MSSQKENTVRIHLLGISALALAAIPAALAVGATGWLGFTITLRGFQLEIQQEHRRAIYVGASEAPKVPMKIVADHAGPIMVDRADLDGEELVVYLKNSGHRSAKFIQLKWSLIAPDGTVIGSEARYVSNNDLGAGERVEVRRQVPEDRRAVVLRLTPSYDAYLSGAR